MLELLVGGGRANVCKILKTREYVVLVAVGNVPCPGW